MVDEESALAISLVGPLRIQADGRHLDVSGLGQQGRRALAFLVSERHRPVRLHELAEVVWDGTLPSTWRPALRGLVSKMRALLTTCGLDRMDVLRSGPGWYQLVLPSGTGVDMEQAAEAVEAAEAALGDARPGDARHAAEAALAIASQPFLVGASGPWVEGRQRHLDDVRLRALEALARSCRLLGAPTAAVDAAEEAVAVDPLRETAHVELMAALAAAGDRARALRAYERCRRLLAEGLG